jgi:hypothetical protein
MLYIFLEDKVRLFFSLLIVTPAITSLVSYRRQDDLLHIPATPN